MNTRLLAAWGAFLCCAACAFWIVLGVMPFSEMRFNPWHHYEYLTQGFAHGHTYLSLEPDPRLLALPDPHDPTTNISYRLWDASLYAGKYYLYFGPTPAVVLMLPWLLVTGHAMSQPVAVAVFACIAMAFLIRLTWEVRRAYFPAVGAGALLAVLLVAFHASWFPVTLRRPGVWELPILTAVACTWAALYFLWRYRRSGGGLGWGAATGVALALGLGARVTGLFSAGLILLLLLVPFPAAGRRPAWRGALLAIGLVGLGGLALLAYNYERFGRLAEFGNTYQLWGADERTIRHFNPAFIPTNAHFYLWSLPTLAPYFPFLRGYWPPDLPAGYINTEEMQGILYVIPVQVAAFVTLAWAYRRRTDPALAPLRFLVLGGAGATLLVGSVLFCFAGACSRYMTELLGGWTVVTTLGLLLCAAHQPVNRLQRLGRILVWVAAGWTVLAVWLASAGFRGFMKVTHPKTFAAIGHVLDYPTWWWAERHAIHYGPLDLELRFPTPPTGEYPLLVNGEPERVNQLRVKPLDRTHVKLQLIYGQAMELETPPLDVSSGRLEVHVEAPWLYPPSEHPYWDHVDPAIRHHLQNYFELRLPGLQAANETPHFYDASSLSPLVATEDVMPAGAPFVAAVHPSAP